MNSGMSNSHIIVSYIVRSDKGMKFEVIEVFNRSVTIELDSEAIFEQPESFLYTLMVKKFLKADRM